MCAWVVYFPVFLAKGITQASGTLELAINLYPPVHLSRVFTAVLFTLACV